MTEDVSEMYIENPEEGIDQFILNRIAEARQWGLMIDEEPYLRIFETIVEEHKKWVVALQGPATMENPVVTGTGSENGSDSVNEIYYQMTRQLEFVTRETYTSRFGKAAPTTPILRVVAQIWRNHPDFKVDWDG